MRHVPFTNLSPSDHASFVWSDLNLRFRAILQRGKFILGEEVEAFEEEFAGFVGVKYCIGVGNGFDALQIILRCLDIKPKDYVIVPSNAPLPVWMAVSNVGAIPYPVEPNPTTYQMEFAYQGVKHDKIKAAIVVHLYGIPADMTYTIRMNTVPIIEDCCQSHGAIYDNKQTGNFGVAAASSFYPTKNLGAYGDGGAILTNHSDLAHKARLMRSYGSGMMIGVNSRLDELQAGFLRLKLKSLKADIDFRNIKAKIYFDKLTGVVGMPYAVPSCEPSWHQFVVRCERRDDLRKFLLDNGIETMIHYPVPCHQMPVYKPLFEGKSYPIAEELSAKVLSLPIGQGITALDVEYVAEKIREFYKP